MTKDDTDMTSTNFAAAASKALTAVAASQERSTSQSKASSTEGERKRAFITMFRRWEVLFKRSDRGDVEAEMWLIAEYYDSLRHLSPEGMDTLTRELKTRCTFFPTIRECLEVCTPKRYDFSNPFYGSSAARLFNSEPRYSSLPAPIKAIASGSASHE